MNKIIGWELALLVASVFIFKSVWTLLEQCPWIKTQSGIVTMFLIGIVLSAVALKRLNSYVKR